MHPRLHQCNRYLAATSPARPAFADTYGLGINVLRALIAESLLREQVPVMNGTLRTDKAEELSTEVTTEAYRRRRKWCTDPVVDAFLSGLTLRS